MANLIIDVGNTRTKVALFKGDDLEHKYSLSHEDEFSFEEQWEWLIDSSSNYIISDVRGNLDHLPKFIIDKAVRITEDTPLPIQIDYQTPKTLGIDRLCNAVAAQHLFPNTNCLVIDMGTCIKYDFVTSKGHYIGGAISPGLGMRVKSMPDYTGELPLIDPEETQDYIGKTSFESINSGIVNGIIHEINGFTEQYLSDFNDLQTIGTGGDFNFFADALKSTIFAHDFLTLSGLNQILIYQDTLK